MAVEAIQQVTELERTVKQEKEAAAAESKQRILEAQRSARRQVEESRQNAEAETRQMMAEAEQEAAKWTASVLEQARLDLSLIHILRCLRRRRSLLWPFWS